MNIITLDKFKVFMKKIVHYGCFFVCAKGYKQKKKKLIFLNHFC